MKTYRKNEVVRIELVLNGQRRSGTCEPRTLLSDFLRQDLGATGTHVGCEHGVCGACTVNIDGVAGRSCMTLAVQAEGCRVETVEGLNAGQEGLSDLQEAFRRNHALQCGFCTAGIMMSCTDYLRRNPDPSELEVREMLSGHLCRCTGYTNIVKAVLETAAERLGRPHGAGLAPDSPGHAGVGDAGQSRLVNA
ncbi:(2Fe-2S)-binding protein [Massilia sp. LC238]|jgi:2-furoyl-CoA dehydrogenase 2Fe-2S iron sulfur subunit|uniref:(2Fe-2S)-binding protein n=1 Tax=Massilia sp. LC238 TaxID=1502852 RepID=UPI0004E2C61E|nr:(2Fe-2S)-binding protein [Massilia sp. LC238]KFC61458.1 Carbon monoxide dehydrogenase small chain [Massilia sp. LC238]